MTRIHLFGNAPSKLLKELGIIPIEMNVPWDAEVPFVTEVFNTRTAGAARKLDEFFKFNFRTSKSYEINLSEMEMDSYEIKIELADIIERAGEPEDLEIFTTLGKLPGVRALIDAI